MVDQQVKFSSLGYRVGRLDTAIKWDNRVYVILSIGLLSSYGE